MTHFNKINNHQTNIMGDFMMNHPNLAKNMLPNCAQGKTTSIRLWEDLATKLNAVGPPVKEAKMWRKVPGLWGTLLGSSVDWFYKTENDGKSCGGFKAGYCFWPKGKMLGGSHAINAMFYIRGASHEYDEWEKAGNPTWGWNEVKRYFKKTEKFRGKNPYGSHGNRGPMNVESFPIPQFEQKILRKAARELGHLSVDDFADGPDIGFGRLYGTLRKGRRFTTAKAFLTKRRPNLHVIKNAFAYKIDFSKDLLANAVHFIYKDSNEMKVEARKEIILSAGSIETPKLLMLSGIGPKTHLNALGIPVKKDLPVGGNLQDHVRTDLFIRYRYGKDKNLVKEFLDSVYNHWVHGEGPYSSAALDLTGFVAIDGNPRLPDIQYMFLPVPNATSYVTPFQDHIGNSIVRQIGEYDRVILAAVVVLKPRSIGNLKLKSTNYREDSLIYPNYFDKPDDLKLMVKGIQNLVKFEHTDIFRKIDGEFLRNDIPECDKFKYGSTRYWECYTRYMSSTLYHYAGTTKMGPKTDKAAVVNPELEVHGVKGLRVVDAGVMPTIIRANINAATIMIGEKGADFIKNKWSVSGMRNDNIRV